jgi:ABC-type antimicrobial peptide transport system permease subunit
VLEIVAATVAICIVVAAVVAWQATRVRPVDVLRYE